MWLPAGQHQADLRERGIYLLSESKHSAFCSVFFSFFYQWSLLDFQKAFTFFLCDKYQTNSCDISGSPSFRINLNSFKNAECQGFGEGIGQVSIIDLKQAYVELDFVAMVDMPSNFTLMQKHHFLTISYRLTPIFNNATVLRAQKSGKASYVPSTSTLHYKINTRINFFLHSIKIHGFSGR